MIKGVLFDMDGVLLDSEQYITMAGVKMFREKGFNVNARDFLAFTGMGENRFLGGVAEKYDIPFELEKDKARAYEIYEILVTGKLSLLPGVESFIKMCREKSLKTAVATSADLVKMTINLRETGLSKSGFDATVNGLEVENKKPDPEIFIKAAGKLGLQPSECLVVEDAISGIQAALKAGCRCLALTTSFPEEKLGEAHWVCKDLSVAPEECLNW